MKKSPQTILFVVSGALFLLGALVLVWWTKNFHAWKLREHLQIISPLFLEITFLLVIVATVLNLRVFKRVFAGITRGSWYAVGGITVIGLLITIFVVPRDHRIYYDEDIYQSIGQNIACLKSSNAHSGEDYEQSFSNVWKRFIGRAAMCNEGRNEYGEFHCDRLEYNKEPNGWPYLLSVVFRLFGVHERAAFLTNNLLYGLAIVTVFLIGYLLFESALPGVYAALIFALTPEFMMWANTTAVEPSAALFPGLALLSALIFVRSRENTALWLLAVMTAFAVQFRPESIMLLMVIGLVVLFWGSYTLRRGEFYLLLAIFFILMIPHLVHLYSFKDAGWGSSGPKFSTEYFKGNFKANALFYLKNIRFPLLFTVLFGLGIVLKAGKGDRVPTTFHLRAKLVLLSWFLLFWGIFIFFYAGSYNYGADVRFSLLSAMPLALLAGYGAVSLEYVFRHRLKFTYLSYVLPVIIAFIFVVIITTGEDAQDQPDQEGGSTATGILFIICCAFENVSGLPLAVSRIWLLQKTPLFHGSLRSAQTPTASTTTTPVNHGPTRRLVSIGDSPLPTVSRGLPARPVNAVSVHRPFPPHTGKRFPTWMPRSL